MNIVAFSFFQIEQYYDLKPVLRIVIHPGLLSGFQHEFENVPAPLVSISLVCGKNDAYSPLNLGHRSFPVRIGLDAASNAFSVCLTTQFSGRAITCGAHPMPYRGSLQLLLGNDSQGDDRCIGQPTFPPAAGPRVSDHCWEV